MPRNQPVGNRLNRNSLTLLLALICGDALAVEHWATNAGQVSAAMQLAQPGDTVVLADGVWIDEEINFSGFGEAGAPITIRPQSPGGVVLTGSSTLSISGDYLVADGLRFEGGALSSGHVVQFRGSNGAATNSRFTNSTIIDYNPASIDTRYFWVSMYGESNRVDHNYFSGQNHSGVTVTVWRDTPAADYHLIDNNYFGDRPEGNGNGFETIRIGTSDQSLSDSYTTVESNVFERVDGEIEIISNKSGSNTFRYNTFRESAGTLTLRHGNNNTVEGNFFLGEGKDRSGGVRVIGEGQTLVNNYFHNLDGRAGGAVSIAAAIPNSPLSGYYQVRDALIAHNTIVGVREAAIKFDEGFGDGGRSLLAEDVAVVKNLIWSNQDPLFDGAIGSNWTWEGNLAWGQALGSAAGVGGITVADPKLSQGEDGLFRLTATSPAVDPTGSTVGVPISTDMDGQPRVGQFDIGADEFSMAALLRTPLTKGDVGPDWLQEGGGPSPGPGGCGLTGCAVQAEDYSSILDPDGDGNEWTVAYVAEALGGAVMKAPLGDRVDLPNEAHDTIVTYGLKFATPGTYTAYYRARGFGSSSDSLFTPDGFNIDPDQTDSLSSDGAFRWEVSGVQFTVGDSHVGVPLELRLAMREQHAELDALVLSLNSDLTDAELDALFDPLDGDFNGDGVVDVADYTVWRDSLGQTGLGLAADADGSGAVDAADYTIWASNYGERSGVSPVGPNAAPEPATATIACLALLCGHARSRSRICHA